MIAVRRLRVGVALVVATLALAGLSGCSSQDETAAAGTKGAPAGAPDWSAVARALGREGKLQDGGVYRVGFPRSDLTVRSRRVLIKPAFALGSYVAFAQTGEDSATVMGDLVLTEDELNAVISRLQRGHVDVTAMHKHLYQQHPPVWWTHVHAEGDPVAIATTVRAALQLTGTPLGQPPAATPQPIDLDTAQLDAILQAHGTADAGVWKYTFPRGEMIREHGMALPAALGFTTALNFQPTGGGRAAINGDFVMTADEVQPVIAALREHDIGIVELHQHGLREEPRLFYMHFWANADAQQLARGLAAALEHTNVKR
jgi:hypothetical protein